MKTEIDRIYNEIMNTTTKYDGKGFTNDEANQILRKYSVTDMEAFNDGMGVNTCMIIDDQIINYHCDIARAVCYALKKQNEES
jgi:hypothetical protein